MVKIKCPCGKIIITSPSRIGRKKYCSKECFYKFKKRPSGLKYKIVSENKGWFKKGNKGQNTGKGIGWIDDYKMISVKGVDKSEHRVKMETFLGRKLNKDEIVHHKDNNKLNNKLNNLEVVSRREHCIIHEIWKAKKY